MFTRCYNIHQVSTRSDLVNFCLNYVIFNVRKSFIVFSGAFGGMEFLLTLKNLIHYNCLNLRLLMILFMGTFNSNFYVKIVFRLVLYTHSSFSSC